MSNMGDAVWDYVGPIRAARGALVAAFLVTGAPAFAEEPVQPPAFTQCLACHSVEPGKATFGPNLRGVGGRAAASLPGYSYSPALKASGLTWDAETLDRWLTAPQKLVPGTRMPFGGIADADKRRAVIDYLMVLE